MNQTTAGAPPLPGNEAGRLAALQGLRILDTPPEERFDRVVRLAAAFFEVPIAFISMVDRDRQWFKAKVGMARPQTPRSISFCGHAILQDDALVVDDALDDPRFAQNPLVQGDPFVRFYAGHPVRAPGGEKVGTLCLMDTKPRRLQNRERDLLGQLARLVEHEFSLVDTIGLQEETLRVKEALIESQKNLAAEKEKSDRLLLNILPKKVAEELKERGRVEAQQYEHACVMFTDFTDFTEISKGFCAGELVEELHACFSRFDEITEKYGVEKLKTIGDGYLCIAGLPGAGTCAATGLLQAALEIRDFIGQRRSAVEKQGKPYWNIRIGIHSGPLVAGVVGVRKFAFDVWGDTVNTAARLETASEPGRINVSKDFLDRLEGRAHYEARGRISLKGKGEMEMFFVAALK